MLRLIIFIIFPSLLLAQKQSSNKQINDSIIDIKISLFDYEPFQIFTKTDTLLKTKVFKVDTIYIGSNSSETLKVTFNEEPLFNKITSKEIYRFIWIRTFHHPIVIRIEKFENTYQLFYKILEGAGGYKWGEIKKEGTRILSPEEWQTFKSLLSNLKYWNLKPGKQEGPIGNDGSTWSLEGLYKNKYNYVTTWTPTKGDYYNACRYLIKIANLQIKQKYIY